MPIVACCHNQSLQKKKLMEDNPCEKANKWLNDTTCKEE